MSEKEDKISDNSDFQPATARCECHGLDLQKCPSRKNPADGPKPLRVGRAYVPNPDGLDNPNEL